MLYRIEAEDKKPAYLQLYEALRLDITNGAWAYGDRLPSKRLIAEEAGVSVITTQHALEMLCQEGYLTARERSGYFAAYRPDDGFFHAVEKTAPRPPRAPGGQDGAEGFPFSVLARHMRRVLADRGEQILEKTLGSGCPELREALAAYLARSRRMEVSPEQIIVGAGAEYLYGLLVTLLGRDRVFAAEKPSYEQIAQVYRANDVSLRLLPLGTEGILSAALWQTDATVLHITPYRSYPSGVTASASKRREYLAWAREKDRFLIEDDFSSEFSVSRKPEDTVFSQREKDNVLYVNTFSQTIAPALRAGYLALPAGLLPAFREKAGFYSCAVPAFEQYVLAELLNSGDFERHINRVRRKRRREMSGEREG